MEVTATEGALQKNRFFESEKTQLPLILYDNNGALSLFAVDFANGAFMKKLFSSPPYFWEPSKLCFIVGKADYDEFSDVIAFYDFGNSRTGLSIFPSSSNFYPYTAWKSQENEWNASRAIYSECHFDSDSLSDICAIYDYGSGKFGVWLFLSSNKFRPVKVYESLPYVLSVNNAIAFPRAVGADGRKEVLLVYFYQDGSVRLFSVSPESKYVPVPVNEPQYLGVRKENVQILGGNFDGDAKEDAVLVAGRDMAAIQIYIFKSTENYQPRYVWGCPPHTWNFSKSFFAIGDYDADGYDDLIAKYRYDQVSNSYFVFSGSAGFNPKRIGALAYESDKAIVISENSGASLNRKVVPLDVPVKIGYVTWHSQPREKLSPGDIAKIVISNVRKSSGHFLTVYDKNNVKLFTSPCSGGRRKTSTVLGTFTVLRKADVIRSFNMRLYAFWPVYFRKHTAIHSWPMKVNTRSLSNFGNLGAPASAGCVRVPADAIYLIWQGSKPGYTVVTVEP